jgi:hypothetical protein
MKKILVLGLLVITSQHLCAQKMLTDMMDTTSVLGKSMYGIYKKYDRLKFSGYIQAQFQMADTAGAKNFEGGDFSTNSNNRFLLRRGRLRIDYANFNEKNQPTVHFVFQFDGTERGFYIRDFWGRVFDTKYNLFSLTTGMFARPFGYEVNLGSADRESPERGRMSQILMKTERDMGVMLTFESRVKLKYANWLVANVGVFNGQGLSAQAVGGTLVSTSTDFDSHKDIIGRLSTKTQKIGKTGIAVTGGISGYFGGITNQSSLMYATKEMAGIYALVRDSAATNIGRIAKRNYYGADVQVKIPNKVGFTELRAEYIAGTQSGTVSSSESPGVYPVSNGISQGLCERSFNGAYFYYLQHLGSTKHQLVLKYDWYDPNTKIADKAVDPTKGFTAADIKFTTIGIGYNYYANTNLRLSLYYAIVNNEKTSIANYTDDLKDNIFTCRLQYRF